MSFAGRNISVKWGRLVCLVVCFALILSSIPIHFKRNSASAQSSGGAGLKRKLPPHYKLPNINSLLTEGKKLQRPTLPRPPLKPATICGYRDEACKRKKEKEKKVSQNFAPSNDSAGQVSADVAQKSERNWLGRLARAFSNALSGLTSVSARGNSFLASDSNRSAGNSAPPVLNNTATGAAPVLPPPSFTSIAAAKLDPRYRVGGAGEDLFSGNYNYSLPLVSLPGRAGLDLNITLSYNSLIWIKHSGRMEFDYDYYGTLTPGFRTGFPEIEPPYWINGYLTYVVYLPSGRRVEMRQAGTNRFEAIDSSYLYLTINPTDSTKMTLYSTDGTQYKFEWPNESSGPRCTQIKDSNGNYITIAYKVIGISEYPATVIDRVIDTLGREIVFNYNEATLHLMSITQDRGGQPFYWAQFDYGQKYVTPNFGGLVVYGPNNTNIPVITRVITADNARHTFSYNSWGQADNILTYGEADNHRASMVYAFPSTAQSDCPRFTQRNDGIFAWPGEVYYPETGFGWGVNYFYFEPNEAYGQVTGPDGVTHREIFSVSGNTRGLTTRTETIHLGAIQQFTDLTWLSDSSASPPLRPRVTEINICDDRNNNGIYDSGTTDKLRRTSIEYTTLASTIRLPEIVKEYNEGGGGVYRSTRTQYLTGVNYISSNPSNIRRIIGLPSSTYLYEGNQTKLVAQTEYVYDSTETGFLQGYASVRQHDTANYSTGFPYRGNLTKMRRYSVDESGTAGGFIESKTGYYITGNVALTKIARDEQTNIETNIYYDDSFSNGVAPNPPTYAYPTKVKDPDNFYSAVKYNYDFGAVTESIDPKNYAISPTNPPVKTVRTYDAKGRLDKSAVWKDGAEYSHIRYVYGTDHNSVGTWTTVNNLAVETAVLHMLDGIGRERIVVNEHPGSQGQLSAHDRVYDKMGRVKEWSRPTEIDSVTWLATGDDSEYIITTQSYDWKGRPTDTTVPDIDPNNPVAPDVRTRKITYNSCGCAGSDVIETQGEQVEHDGTVGRRKTKTYRDVLGREIKTEVLNWGGGVDSTKVTTYNIRGQISVVRVFQGQSPISDDGVICPTGTCQKTEMVYDGYGRLEKHYRPIYQATPTVPNPTPYDQYEYNADNTVKKMIDPRGVVKEYSYNNRALLAAIAYTLPAGVLATPNVSYGYDEAGNRIWMETAGLTHVDYAYDSLSRLESETRSFLGVAWPPPSHTMSYGYNLVGQIKSVNSGGKIVTYGYDNAGRLTSVTGNGYAYQSLMSGAKYRAWGGPKQYVYGAGGNFAFAYDSRMRVAQKNISNRVTDYSYYEDGGIKQILSNTPANDGGIYLYEYDHVGRLSDVRSGSYVTPSAPIAPYHETYGYDAFSHLAHRTSRTVENEIQTDSSYINDRNQTYVTPPYSTYDRAGNLVLYNTINIPPQYDAEGRKVYDMSGVIRNYYDGDGALIRQQDTTTYPPNPPNPYSGDTFYFTATPLGGAVATTYLGLKSNYALRTNDYVYAGSERIASQLESGGIANMNFEYIDTIARLYISNNGAIVPKLFDPLGNPADVTNSPVVISPYEFTGLGGGYRSGTCFLDGFVEDCSVVAMVLAGSAGAPGPWQTSRSNPDTGEWEFPMVAPSGRIAWETTGGGVRMYELKPDGSNGALLSMIEDGPDVAYVNAVAGELVGGGWRQGRDPRPTPTPKMLLPDFMDVTLVFSVGKGELSLYKTGGGKRRECHILKATSGNGVGLNNSERANRRNSGAIPLGDYFINSDELNIPDIITAYFRNLKADWGSFRVPINPVEGTETYGRDGFKLHGGSRPGSAGCIDVGGGTYGNDETWRLVNAILLDRDRKVWLSVIR